MVGVSSALLSLSFDWFSSLMRLLQDVQHSSALHLQGTLSYSSFMLLFAVPLSASLLSVGALRLQHCLSSVVWLLMISLCNLLNWLNMYGGTMRKDLEQVWLALGVERTVASTRTITDWWKSVEVLCEAGVQTDVRFCSVLQFSCNHDVLEKIRKRSILRFSCNHDILEKIRKQSILQFSCNQRIQ